MACSKWKSIVSDIMAHSDRTATGNTFDDVQEQTERQIQKFFGLMQLSQVDFSTMLGCSVQLLVTVSVCKPHHLGKKQVITKLILHNYD